MFDHLKSTKTIHYTLLIAALSIATFCIAPQDSMKYQAAHQEVEILVRASIGSYKKYLKNKNKELNKLYSETLAQAFSNPPLSLKVKKKMRYKGPLFISSDSDTNDLAGIYKFFTRNNETTYLAIAITSDDGVLMDASLGLQDEERSGRCLDYDLSTWRFVKIKCQPFNKEDDIVTSIEVVNLDREDPPSIVPVEHPMAPGAKWRAYLETIDSEGDTWKYLLENYEFISTPEGHVKNYENWLYDKHLEMGGSLYNKYPIIKIKNWATNLAITHFIDFSAPQDPNLSMPASLIYKLIPLDSFEYLFPALTKCWDEVKEKTPADALIYLKAKADSTRRSISLFGIQIEYSYLFLAGPIVIFVLLVMLSSTLKNALNSFKEKGNWAEIADSSWFGLSSQTLPRVMMFTSIVILPFFVAVFAVILDQGAASYLHILALLLCLAILVPAIDAARALKKLRLMAAEAVYAETSPKRPAHVSFRRRSSKPK